MTDPVTTITITLAVEGDGTALKLCEGVSTFGLTSVKASRGTVMWVPDPDNPEQNTIFWVQRAAPWTPEPASGTVTLTLTYPAE